MRIDLKPNQVRLLDLLLGLDLEAAGLNRAQQRTAHSIHILLHETVEAMEEPNKYEPLRVLRLTPSYRHSDK